jgi:hypothetical protein
MGNAMATDLHVLAGFDASSGQLWNPTESPSFNLAVGEVKEIVLT